MKKEMKFCLAALLAMCAQETNAASATPGEQRAVAAPSQTETWAAEAPREESKWSFSVSTGGGFAPRYEGSDRTAGTFFGSANAVYDKGRFFAGLGGIGFSPLITDEGRISLGFAYGGDREEKDDRRNLRGLGDIDGSALSFLTGEYDIGLVRFGSSIAHGLGGDYGTVASFSIGMGMDLSEKLSVTSTVKTEWANKKHMQHYFGVTERQAAASGKKAFQTEDGFKKAALGLGAAFNLTEHWSTNATFETGWLLGDADKSPVTVRTMQTSGLLGITYSF